VLAKNMPRAKKYVDWLSKRTGKIYRLLTEAGWEYAARAGTTTRFSSGHEQPLPAVERELEALGEYAWFLDNSEGRAHVVGGKKANPFGLHDMHGNVWEWVEDCYSDNYNGADSDGSARTSNNCSSRVHRGGAWTDLADRLRSARRDGDRPYLRFDYLASV
jgi:formylglycine-generating enzyme required for sulfatase activity